MSVKIIFFDYKLTTRMNRIYIILFIVFLSLHVYAQEVDIVPALQQIENGNIKSAETFLRDLKVKNANDPSVIFLDAVLTKDGEEALKKYSTVLEKYPNSKYADAVLYRIFSYYYSLGYYKKAETYLYPTITNRFPYGILQPAKRQQCVRFKEG